MKKLLEKNVLISCLSIFGICLIFRLIEYFFIKTDQTYLSENFIHKLIGILVLYLVSKLLHKKWGDIGFGGAHIAKNIGKGLMLGAICFGISYLVEFIIQVALNKNPSFGLYVNGFSLTGNEVVHTETHFFLICIIFNIINVVMEEGVFRGLFANLLSKKYNFRATNLIVALLFGVWHFVMPLRSYVVGEMSLMSMLFMMIGYIVLAGIMSIKWGLLYKISGSLWIGLGDHLFNNVVATNILHIVTSSGADELQIVRILIAQLISFAFILITYKRKYDKGKSLFSKRG